MRYIFLTILLLWTSLSLAAEVLVVVGENAITTVDVDQRIAALKLANPRITESNEYRTQILHELINEELFCNESSRLKIFTSKEELDGHFKNLQKRYNFSNEQTKVFSTNNSLRKQVESQLVWNKLIEAVFANKIKVSDAEVRDEQKIIIKEVKEVTFKQIIFANNEVPKAKNLMANNCDQLDVEAQKLGLEKPIKNTLLLSDLNFELQSLLKSLPVNKLSEILNFQDEKQLIMVCSKKSTNIKRSRQTISQELSNRKINSEAQKYLGELRKRVCIEYVKP
jgi:hypothetical protein